jgi:hypothetical protein
MLIARGKREEKGGKGRKKGLCTRLKGATEHGPLDLTLDGIND